jgi:hypothetical protein
MSSDSWFIIFIIICVVLFAGEPDIHDVIISHLSHDCPVPIMTQEEAMELMEKVGD